VIAAPKWLPYRLRSSWDTARINAAVTDLRHATPRAATPPESASAEVHMLVCKRDLRLAGLSLLSLLRYELPLAVTVTEDGSLTANDRAWLNRLIPGVRWLARRVEEPTFQEVLQSFPRLAELYAGGYHPICKLLHPICLGRCERIIVLDPDTVFFQYPELLSEWVAGSDSRDYYLHDHQDEATAVPESVRTAFVQLADITARFGQRWSLAYYLFNSGLLWYHRKRMNLDVAEAYLTWRIEQPHALRSGIGAIWFGDWTPEQTGYMAMFATANPTPVHMPDDYWLGGGNGHTFNHFLRHYLIQTETQQRIHQLAKTL